MNKRLVFTVLLSLFLTTIVGCNLESNLFSIFHKPGNPNASSEILIADGESFLLKANNETDADKKAELYEKAAEYFGLALVNDPENEEALLGQANALILGNDLDLISILSVFLSGAEGGEELPNILPDPENTNTEALTTIVNNYETLVNSNDEYSSDANINLSLGIYKAELTYLNLVDNDNDNISIDDSGDGIDFNIHGATETKTLSYLLSTSSDTWSDFKQTLDTPAIISETETAINDFESAIGYIAIGGESLPGETGETTDGIKEVFSEISGMFEEFKIIIE